MSKLWLDLELREDIDDYATLIYAIESGDNIKYLSINNPSIEEIKLFNFTIEKFNLDVDLIISGEVKNYPDKKNIHNILMKLIDGYTNTNYIHIDDLKIDSLNDFIVFCGGSLTTLSILTERFDVSTFKAYIQGGFASYKILNTKDVLKKFKNRDKVPTWNLNLDLEATDKVLNSNLEAKFISKNICHNSWVHTNELSEKDCFFNFVLKEYFNSGKYNDKCLHDLLAYLSINTDIVNFKKIDLLRTNEERPKFWSELNPDSNFSISTSFSIEDFKSKIFI
jgi:hypothetical protein